MYNKFIFFELFSFISNAFEILCNRSLLHICTEDTAQALQIVHVNFVLKKDNEDVSDTKTNLPDFFGYNNRVSMYVEYMPQPKVRLRL
jgi:hypothetical protein